MKKIFALILLLTAVLSIFPSCGNNEPYEDNTSSDTSNHVTANAEQETKVQEEVAERKPDIKIDIDKITNTEENKLEYYGDYSDKQIRGLNSMQVLLESSPNAISILGFTADGKKSFCYNSSRSHSSACTVKAGYVLALCKFIEKYEIDINQTLTYENKHFYGGTGEIQKSEFGTEYTLEYLMTVCLSISDNIAYKMLIECFGLDFYNEYMREIGADSLTIKNGQMFASKMIPTDLAKVWVEIFNYFNTNTPMSKVLYNACTNPEKYNYAAKGIVGRWDFSHKSGENNWQVNDAVIVWKDIPYILIICTNASYKNVTNRNLMTDICNQVHFNIFE